MISRQTTLLVLLCVTWLVRPQPLIAQGEVPIADAAPEIKTEEVSPLVKEPTTPDEYMDAVIFTMKIARPEAAKKYIEGLLALDPDDATLIGFRSKHGTGAFLQLARLPDLNPPAAELLERLNAASTRQANDPVFLDSVLKKLSGSPRESDLAIRDLQHLGAQAVSRLVQAGADLNSGVDRDQAFVALTRMGQPAVAPLIGYLYLGDESQKLLAVEAFGWVASKSDIPFLYSTAFSTDGETGLREAARQSISRLLYRDPNHAGRLEGFGAAAELRKNAEKLLKGETTLEPEDDGMVPVWIHEDASASLVEQGLSSLRSGVSGGAVCSTVAGIGADRHPCSKRVAEYDSNPRCRGSGLGSADSDWPRFGARSSRPGRFLGLSGSSRSRQRTGECRSCGITGAGTCPERFGFSLANRWTARSCCCSS